MITVKINVDTGVIMQKISFLLIGTSLSLIPNLTFAQCVATQDCETLGYTETSCNGGKGVKCPFGNKWACFKTKDDLKNELCQDLGFKLDCNGENQLTSNYSCNGKYNYCNCADGYNWKNGNCEQACSQADYSNCVVGTIYYNDNTCSSKLETGKEPLGVVVYEKTASENGWVMAVNPIATQVAWGISGTSTGITSQAAQDSCTNTQQLVALGSNYVAAIKANSYNAGGKKWCLPSYGVLENINNQTNFDRINIGISAVGGRQLGFISSTYSYENILSSSEYSNYEAWNLYAVKDGQVNISHFYKYGFDTSSVRPVFAF